MSYPEEMIPQPGYIIPFPFEVLIEQNGDYLLNYRISGSVEENCEIGTFGGKRKLKRECFSHVVHMSMNLHGGMFRPEYVRYVQKKPGSDSWDGQSKICLEDYVNVISEEENATPIFYEATKLCVRKLSTYLVFNNNDSYKAMKSVFPDCEFPKYQPGVTVTVYTDIKIEHVPTILNYWHVQMEVYPQSNDEKLKDARTWRERVFNNIRDSILCYRYMEKPNMDYSIDKDIYMKYKSE